MNLIEMNRALRQLRLGGMAAVLETRIAASPGGSDVAHRPNRLPHLRRAYSSQ